jgi:hypothetical protein
MHTGTTYPAQIILASLHNDGAADDRVRPDQFDVFVLNMHYRAPLCIRLDVA